MVCTVYSSLQARFGAIPGVGRPSHYGTGPYLTVGCLLLTRCCSCVARSLVGFALQWPPTDACPVWRRATNSRAGRKQQRTYGAALATEDISRLATMEVSHCTHDSRMHCEGRLTSAVGRRVVFVRVCVCLGPPRRLGGLAQCSTWGCRRPGTACGWWGERASPQGRHHAASVVTPGQVTAPFCAL